MDEEMRSILIIGAVVLFSPLVLYMTYLDQECPGFSVWKREILCYEKTNYVLPAAILILAVLWAYLVIQRARRR